MNPIVTIKMTKNYTPEEIKEKANELAEKSIKAVTLEEEKKSVAASYKNKIDFVKEEIDRLSKQIIQGFEENDVKCEVTFNDPEEGFKTIRKFETGETVNVLPMEDADYDLFNQPRDFSVPNNPDDVEEAQYELAEHQEGLMLGEGKSNFEED